MGQHCCAPVHCAADGVSGVRELVGISPATNDLKSSPPFSPLHPYPKSPYSPKLLLRSGLNQSTAQVSEAVTDVCKGGKKKIILG